MVEFAIREYEHSIFTEEALVDCRRIHDELRVLGGVVYLSKHRLYAATSYAAVTELLGNQQVFSSDKGVGVSILNRLPENRDSLLMSDGEDHRRRRSVFMEPLTTDSLKDLQETISVESEQLVGRLMETKSFDVVKDFASYLPTTVVSKLVGLPEDVEAKMIRWAPVTFDMIGPLTRRVLRLLPSMGFDFLRTVRGLSEDDVVPGSWADGLFKAIRKDEISLDEARALIVAYIIPSLDTTIIAAAHMFWLLARHPQIFNEIKSDKDLIPSAVNEIVRLASPVIGFTRFVNVEAELCGYKIPKGKRIIALLPSANRDESKYPNPDTFDIRRDPRDHVAFGYGRHRCAGVHLAKLELEELLRALCGQAKTLTVSHPEYLVNSSLQGFKTLRGNID